MNKAIIFNLMKLNRIVIIIQLNAIVSNSNLTDRCDSFSCQVYPNLSIEETIIQQHIEQTSGHLVYKFDKLCIRHWDEYMLGKCHHRFIASIARNSQWSFNDNGNSFAFTRQHDETSQVVWSTNLDIPPVAFLIHGGSQNSWYNTWGRGWSFQAFAAQGYAVIAINFHGSDSYGQNFTDSITGEYGSLHCEDLQLGLTAALKRYPYIDET
ncbi:unnamed protein product [Rotaria socialis]